MKAPEARGRSVFDVLSAGVGRFDAQELTALLRGLRATESGLGAIMRSARTGYYINNAHPIIRIGIESLGDAPKDSKLIEALLKASNRPEFTEAVREISMMSRAYDGRLKDLISTTLTLFHRYASNGFSPITTQPYTAPWPAMRIVTRHNWSARDLDYSKLALPKTDFVHCRQVNLAEQWNSTTAEANRNFVTTLACVSDDEVYSGVAQGLEVLLKVMPNGLSTYQVLVDSYNAMEFKPHIETLVRIGFDCLNDGRIWRALRSVPILTSPNFIDPISSMTRAIINQGESHPALKRLAAYGSTILHRDDIQPVVAHWDDRWRLAKDPITQRSKISGTAWDPEKIARWIKNKECATVTTAEARADRLNEVIDEYHNAAVDHDRLKGRQTSPLLDPA